MALIASSGSIRGSAVSASPRDDDPADSRPVVEGEPGRVEGDHEPADPDELPENEARSTRSASTAPAGGAGLSAARRRPAEASGGRRQVRPDRSAPPRHRHGSARPARRRGPPGTAAGSRSGGRWRSGRGGGRSRSRSRCDPPSTAVIAIPEPGWPTTGPGSIRRRISARQRSPSLCTLSIGPVTVTSRHSCASPGDPWRTRAAGTVAEPATSTWSALSRGAP